MTTTTTIPPIPKAINPRWLVQRKEALSHMAPSCEYRDRVAQEIAEAEAELERRTAFENWIRQKGWRINSYTVRTPFGSCEPGQAVIAKKNGTWTFLMTLAAAWEQYCCSQQ